jgi:hypothetical protein
VLVHAIHWAMESERDRWRIEADDEWLATHRSDSFARLRRRMQRLGLVGDAVSQAELGPFGGAPRNPRLKPGTKAYAYVRHATHRIAYTTIYVELHRCRYCGRRIAEVHRIVYVRRTGDQVVVGALRACRRCQGDSWLFRSRMPGAVRARALRRKVVL